MADLQNTNMTIQQGSDFLESIQLIVKSTGLPFDLTGWTADGMLRLYFSDTIPVATFISTGPFDSTGTFTMSLSSSVTYGLNPWPDTDCGKYHYDYNIIRTSDGFRRRIVQGKAKVSPTATK